ncbi:MAG: hypothetical protein JXB07_18485 [Anaerolineae bacterium]|nr:hypothetical protein [Anaerolineae bacterium]
MMLQRFFSVRCGLVSLVLSAFLQAGFTVVDNRATLDFPNAIDFHLEATSQAEIVSARLEIRTDALACGESATQIVPDDFTPGQSVTVDWRWELRRTGALPPGTLVWWRWILQDAGGEQYETPEEQLIIEDDTHQWQQVESDKIVLRWYNGTEDFARLLLDAGQATVDSLEESLDFTVDEPIQVYVYATPTDMQSATLFAPGWSGGLAFTNHGTLLMAVGPSEETWGQRVIAHELNHIVVGRYTFSCMMSIPNWFGEGFAMYSEGEPEAYYTNILNEAIEADRLLSVRELGQIFSNDPDVALLSYAQSQSLVTFLIEKYGEDKIPLLLDRFKEGYSEDRALMEVYEMDRNGLEVAWREWVGAAPMQDIVLQSATTPTPYPTFAPIVEPPQAVSEVRPTQQYLATLDPGIESKPPTSSTDTSMWNGAILLVGSVVMICIAGVAILGTVVVVGLIFLRRQQKDVDMTG